MADDDLRRWADQLADAAGGALRRELVRRGKRLALLGERTAKDHATYNPRSRSGHLRRSINGEVRGGPDGLDIVLRAGGGKNDVRYAGVQEDGGTISAKGGGMLAIPLRRAKTASGVTKGRFQVPGGLRNVPGLFLWESPRTGKLFLAESKGRGKRKRLELLFVLKDSVTLKPKKFLESGVLHMMDYLDQMWSDVVDVSTSVERAKGAP